MNFKEISTNLPDSFRHSIIYHNEKEKRVNLRSDLKTDVECKLWIQKFSEATNTRWVIRDIESDSYVFSFCAVYICHLSSYSLKNIDKKDGCLCAITFMIKKVNNRSLVNPHIQEGFIASITISYNHFHSALVENESSIFQLRANYLQASYDKQDDSYVDIEFKNFPIKPKTSHEQKLKNILEAYRNKGYVVEHRENPTILVIITPVMQRAQQLPLAKDIVFVDSSPVGSNSPYTVTFMLAHCRVKAIPLAIIIMEGNSKENFLKGFSIAKENFGPYSFCGQGYPFAIMTDNSAEETYATSTLWPESTSMICRFQVIRPVMKWVQDLKEVTKPDRRELLKMFNELVACKNIEEAENLYLICNGTSENKASHLARKYPQWVNYINSLWLEKEKWCIAYRSYRTRGYHTNNVSKTFIRLFKSFVVSRCQEISLCSLLYHTCEEIDHHYRTKLLNIANGRMDSAKRMIRRNFKKAEFIKKESIKILGPNLFSVPKENNTEEKCLVDLSLGCCSCSTGKFGAFCEHQAALYLHFQRLSPGMPFIPTSERYSMAVLALGRSAKNVFHSLPVREKDEVKNHNILIEALQTRKHCEAPGCEVRTFNISEGQKKLIENGIILSFYKFSQKNRNTWTEAAKIPKQILQENSHLCSLHFTNYCFNLNNELYEDAVPTVFFVDFLSHVEELLKQNLPYNFDDDDDGIGESGNYHDRFSVDLNSFKSINKEVVEYNFEMKPNDETSSDLAENNILFPSAHGSMNPNFIVNETIEIIDCDFNSRLEDYDGLIACEEIVIAENHISNSKPNKETSPSNSQNNNESKTLDDLINLLSSMENATSKQGSTISSSFKNVIPRLLSIFKTAKTKQENNSATPSIYIIADKLDEEETDFGRRTVAVSPVEAVFVVNDMMKSFKNGINTYVNSEDINLLCMNPVMVSMKYVTLNNADPLTNCIYIITTEKSKYIMHKRIRNIIKKKNAKKEEERKKKKKEERRKKEKKPVKKNNNQTEISLVENDAYLNCDKKKGKRSKSKMETDTDELKNFKMGEKWYISSTRDSSVDQDSNNIDMNSGNVEESNLDPLKICFQTDATKNVEGCDIHLEVETSLTENQNAHLNRDSISLQLKYDPDSQNMAKNVEECYTNEKIEPSLAENQNPILKQDSISSKFDCHSDQQKMTENIKESDANVEIESFFMENQNSIDQDLNSFQLDCYDPLLESIEDTSEKYSNPSNAEQCDILSEIKILELETFSESESENLHYTKEFLFSKKNTKIFEIENIVINAEPKNVKTRAKKRKLQDDQKASQARKNIRRRKKLKRRPIK